MHHNAGHISNLRNGKAQPSPELAQDLDDALDADGALVRLTPPAGHRRRTAAGFPADDEIAAVELARRAEASDVGDGTVERLELVVDDLATAYPGTPPADLLRRVKTHLGCIGQLLDTRYTLSQHRRMLVTGGWLSLLAATCLIDLHRDHAASTHLRTAAQLAREAGHAEIAAWCLETRAWQVLTEGDYRLAVDIARAALARVETLVSPLPVPDRPEHHYRYDPAKSEAYVATTLAWLGDPAAEG